VFPQLKAALFDWVRDAVNALATDGSARYETTDLGHWKRDSDGIFRYADRPVVVWEHQAISDLFELPSWQAVLEVIHGDDRINRQVDTFVGALGHGGRHVDAGTLGWRFLPLPGELDRLAEAFEDRYTQLEAFLAADEVEYALIWPMPGLTSDVLPVRLEPGLELDVMSDHELGVALDVEIVRTMFPRDRLLNPGYEQGTCVRYLYKVPKVVGEFNQDESQSAGARVTTKVQEIESALKETLAIVLPDAVGIAGRFGIVAQPGSLLSGGTNFQYTTMPPVLRMLNVHLSSDQAVELEEVWRLLHRPGLLRRNKGLALALRRLSYQAQRERPEDELLDTMIAAEALYLFDMGKAADRGELRYRRALRAALWSEPDRTGFTKREVLGIMRYAYHARSAIAHGGTPKPDDMKIRGDKVQLVELAKAAKTITISGCRRALAGASGRNRIWPPDWDALALGE
jgi:Apea-like HEPN